MKRYLKMIPKLIVILLALIGTIPLGKVLAEESPLTGKDLHAIVQKTDTEGADEQKYIGHRFADKVVFWRMTGTSHKRSFEVVSFDANLHPSYTESIYISCPIDAESPLAKLASSGGLKQDDKLTIDGLISDVVSASTPDEPTRELLVLKSGSHIQQGWR
jgi:hypothetical protein